MNDLLLSFYGDDFTGSTDAMESLARAGVRTVLFAAPPTAEQLARYPGLRAFGVAGTTRAMSPEEMERTLRPAFVAMHECGAPVVHYKVCSTFDSSPAVGSIGRAIDVGTSVFGRPPVPVVVGAPALGRYCVFGNLFARLGAGGAVHRLDRHPSMSRHPTTPMTEADLRLHLARQTDKPIALFDVRALDLPTEEVDRRYAELLASRPEVVLIDLLTESQLPTVGRLLATGASRERPVLVVGSSGVESALVAHWRETGAVPPSDGPGPARAADGPIVALCGSCSPVTGGQIGWAVEHGFAEVRVEPARPDPAASVAGAVAALEAGRSVVIHTGGSRGARVDDADACRGIGPMLGRVLRGMLGAVPGVRRVVVAGGDTSGAVAGALGIESLEMVAELVRGSPLCRATAPGSPADGVEFTFKGGQIGPVDFLGLVQHGATSHG